MTRPPHLRLVETAHRKKSPLDKLRFVEAMAADRDLTPNEVRCGILLLELYNEDFGGAWPSYVTIGQMLGVSEKSATVIVASLVRKSYFDIEPSGGGGGGRGRSNRYAPRWETLKSGSGFMAAIKARKTLKRDAVNPEVRRRETLKYTSVEPSESNPVDSNPSARRRTGEPSATPDPVPRAQTQQEAGVSPPPPPPAARADVAPDGSLGAGRCSSRPARRSTGRKPKTKNQPTLEQVAEQYRGKIHDLDILIADVRKRAKRNPAGYLRECCENELQAERKARAQGFIARLERRGVRQVDIADAVGVAQSVVSLWKSSAKRAPTVEQLARLEALDAEHEARAKAAAAEAEREQRARKERDEQERAAYQAHVEQQQRERQERGAQEQRERECAAAEAAVEYLEIYRRGIDREGLTEALEPLVNQLVAIVGDQKAGQMCMDAGLQFTGDEIRLQQAIAKAKANGAA